MSYGTQTLAVAYRTDMIVEDVLGEVLKSFGHTGSRYHAEVSGYRSVRDLEHVVKSSVEWRLAQVYAAIRREWLRMEKANVFKIGGKVYLNPRTGKPLTPTEWATIKKSLQAALAWVYDGQDEVLARTALALGKVLNTMPIQGRIDAKYEAMVRDIAREKAALTDEPQWRNAVAFADEYAAESITNLVQNQTKAIHDAILDAMRGRQSVEQLESRLLDTFGDFNRDWRAISETEIANAFNNGFLMSEMEGADPGERVYMKGVSAAGACEWCRSRVHGKVFLLLGTPLVGDDRVSVSGSEHVAIWPNKSNVGRPRADWWVASGAQHPHCRCTFVRYRPGFERHWDALHAAMSRAEAATAAQAWRLAPRG